MSNTTISTGVVHKVHTDLRAVLTAYADLRTIWNGLTPLARNEWICWMTIAKGENTRAKRLGALFNPGYLLSKLAGSANGRLFSSGSFGYSIPHQQWSCLISSRLYRSTYGYF